MRRLPVGSLIVLVLLVSSVAADPETSHTKSVKTEHFEVRYRPGSRAGARAEEIADDLEHDLARIGRTLAIEPKGRWKALVYDDVEELALVTGTTGNCGFATGDTIHLPHDVAQTRLHELVHVVAVTALDGQGHAGLLRDRGLGERRRRARGRGPRPRRGRRPSSSQRASRGRGDAR
jgi:hypothetical protein